MMLDGNGNALTSLAVSASVQALDVRPALARVLNDAYAINGAGANYTVGDIVSQDNGAGTAQPIHWSTPSRGEIKRAVVSCNNATITNAQFKLHLWTAAPTVVVGSGDNDAISGQVTFYGSTYLGCMVVALDQLGSNGAAGAAYPSVGAGMIFDSADLYGLLEATNTYDPNAGQAFKISLEIA